MPRPSSPNFTTAKPSPTVIRKRGEWTIERYRLTTEARACSRESFSRRDAAWLLLTNGASVSTFQAYRRCEGNGALLRKLMWPSCDEPTLHYAAEEAADASKSFHPKIVIPYHYRGLIWCVQTKGLDGLTLRCGCSSGIRSKKPAMQRRIAALEAKKIGTGLEPVPMVLSTSVAPVLLALSNQVGHVLVVASQA